jgi:hypothetical protein
MNTAEWKAELENLRVSPGHLGVRHIYWRTWLDQARPGPAVRILPTRREVRRMTPAQRVEMNQGRPLEPGTQVLRCGRDSWYLIEPDRPQGRGSRVRVY